jgi:hypothetical protein
VDKRPCNFALFGRLTSARVNAWVNTVQAWRSLDAGCHLPTNRDAENSQVGECGPGLPGLVAHSAGAERSLVQIQSPR